MESDFDKIGNVIRILDKRTLIIDVGNDNISIGDKIKVYKPVDVLRNIDGSELCMYEYIKAILEVIDVEKYYSVCQYQKTKSSTNVFSLSPLLSTESTKYIDLDVDESEIEPLNLDDSRIHVGDSVKFA